MPYQPLYVLEAVDLRRADQAGSSRALTVSKLGVPEIKRKTSAYQPGGGNAEVQFAFPILDPIFPKFELKGYDEDVLNYFGMTAGNMDRWTFAGALRQKQGGQAIPSRCVIEGVLEQFTPDEYTPGSLMGCNYQLCEVTHLEFSIDGAEIIYFDFYERVTRSGGVDRFSDVRLALGA